MTKKGHALKREPPAARSLNMERRSLRFYRERFSTWCSLCSLKSSRRLDGVTAWDPKTNSGVVLCIACARRIAKALEGAS